MRPTLILIAMLGMIGESEGKKCKTCRTLFKQGRTKDQVYTLRLWDKVAKRNVKVKAFCDMTNGGYTQFLRRQDKAVSFDRTWKQYKKGFGKTAGNYWLGNDHLHLLTSNCGPQSLRVDMETCTGIEGGKIYSTFQVGDEASSYKLKIGGVRGGPVSDGFTTPGLQDMDGMRFTTKDRDNDLVTDGRNCATLYEIGGWWYNQCSRAIPTGPYDDRCLVSTGTQAHMSWFGWPKPAWNRENGMVRMTLGLIDADALPDLCPMIRLL